MGGGVQNTLSLKETTQICQEITGHKIPIASVAENRQGDVPIFITDARKVTNMTKWKPKRDALMTLTDIYRWIVENESQVRGIFV